MPRRPRRERAESEPGRREHRLFLAVAHRDAGARRRGPRVRPRSRSRAQPASRSQSHRWSNEPRIASCTIPSRVIAKPYLPGEEIFTDTGTRAGLLMARILALPEDEVARVLGETLASFAGRHRQVRGAARAPLRAGRPPRGRRGGVAGAAPPHRRLLHERVLGRGGRPLQSVARAARPIRPASAADETRFVMSLRAVGEGHISSIEFRTGVLDGSSTVTFDPLGPCLVTGDRAPPAGYDKASFRAKLARARRGQRRRLGDHRSAAGAVHARRARSDD